MSQLWVLWIGSIPLIALAGNLGWGLCRTQILARSLWWTLYDSLRTHQITGCYYSPLYPPRPQNTPSLRISSLQGTPSQNFSPLYPAHVWQTQFTAQLLEFFLGLFYSLSYLEEETFKYRQVKLLLGRCYTPLGNPQSWDISMLILLQILNLVAAFSLLFEPIQ